MTIPLAETPTVGLGRFIKESRFLVPTHQRDYSWTDEYVRTFLRDIEEALRRDDKIYFCGLMVFTKTDTLTLKVLDGQQRLATTLMIFSAIRNWLARYGAYKTHELKISEWYLASSDLDSTVVESKMSLTPANNDAFRKYVIEAVPVADILKELRSRSADDRSKTLLRSAYVINRQIEMRAKELGSPEAAKDYFVRLATYIAETVQIVRFVVRGDQAAYTIFETLNDRGLALAPLDLVKNYLFSRAELYREGGLREVEDRWAEMMALLGSDRADSFLRAYWTSRTAKMEGRRLFSAFKKANDDPAKVYQTSIDLRSAAEGYSALFSSADPLWSGYSDSARQSVDALAIIGASQTHPIILAALERFNRREMERLLWLLEVIAVRYQLVGQGRTARIEKLGGKAAGDIFDRKITTATAVRAALDDLYVSDADFRNRFLTETETQGKKARYLLAGLERQSLQREGKTFPDELVPGNVTLEHIFPRSPGELWGEALEEDPKMNESMIYRLGNMCLLTNVNRALGNKPWPVKAAAFAQSRLNTTKSLAKYSDWGGAQIIERQTHLAELAVAAWRFQ